MNKFLLFSAIVLVTTFFTFSKASFNSDPLVYTFEEPVTVKIIQKIEKDNKFFAVIRHEEASKMYLKTISEDCFNEPSRHLRLATLTQMSWQRKSGESGQIFTDPNNALCSSVKNSSKKA